MKRAWAAELANLVQDDAEQSGNGSLMRWAVQVKQNPSFCRTRDKMSFHSIWWTFCSERRKQVVMPTNAGIQSIGSLDSCFRRNDVYFSMSFAIDSLWLRLNPLNSRVLVKVGNVFSKLEIR
jgi:hypothetical protein